MKTLLVDNYDSYTFNLFQLLAEVNGEEPLVVRNDETSWLEVAEWDFDNVVLSPGPGHPARTRDFGVCKEALAAARMPLLGVCLGHQGLAQVAGGDVVYAPEPAHGRLSAVFHDGSALFEGIPQGFQAVRYHSLVVSASLPSCLEVIAWTSEGLVMGLRHRERPQWGVQFHPESICTEYGRTLLENFRSLTDAARTRRSARRRASGEGVVPTRRAARAVRAGPPLRLCVEEVPRLYDPELAFASLFGRAERAFWLDSSAVDGALGRFSFVGGGDGPLARFVEYDVASKEVRVTSGDGSETRNETLFEYFERELARECASPALPFDLNGGFVGYLGYELKADCGGALAHRSPLPDAALLFADRFVAFDHLEGRTYIAALAEGDDGDAVDWMRRTRRALDRLEPLPPPAGPRALAPISYRLSRPYDRYVDDVERCKRYLADGETYEVCLTNRLTVEASLEPLALYRTLRRLNPAPFSAFLRFGNVAVLCSSPERFLRIAPDRFVEARPIKGTAPRGRTASEDATLREGLERSEKNRAENLMIVDLLRNDLGVVCEVGSIDVPALMAIESYETVHQLVSTITGRLRPDLGAIDCLRAAFPGGSMTGAPKRRTMEIIDRLEGEARGVYSGAIGFVALNGAADLNVVIRTIVMDGDSLSIGAGGAIVAQSDADEEYREMLLKATAVTRAIDAALTGRSAARTFRSPARARARPRRPRSSPRR